MRTPFITLAALVAIVTPVLAQPSASPAPPDPADLVEIRVEAPANEISPGSSGGPRSIFHVDRTQYNVRKLITSKRPCEDAAVTSTTNGAESQVAGFPAGPRSIFHVDRTQYNVRKLITSTRPSDVAPTTSTPKDAESEVVGFPAGPRSVYHVDRTQYNVRKLITSKRPSEDAAATSTPKDAEFEVVGFPAGPRSVYHVDRTQYNVRKLITSNKPCEDAATLSIQEDVQTVVVGENGGNEAFDELEIAEEQKIRPDPTVVIDSRSELSAAAGYELADVAPNPVTESASITYTVPQAGYVSLTVFDATGRVVATLVDGDLPAGTHSIRFDATDLTPGNYLYRLSSGGFATTKMLSVVR